MAGISLQRTARAARHPIVDARLDDLTLDALQRLGDRRRTGAGRRHRDHQAAIGLALVALQEAEDVDILVRTQAVGADRHLHVQRLDARIEMDGMAQLGIVEPDCQRIVEPPLRSHAPAASTDAATSTRMRPARSGALRLRLGIAPAPHGFTPLSG